MTQQARPRRIEHITKEDGSLVPVYATGTVEQPYADYGQEDHGVWAHLVRRQDLILANRACQEWLDARSLLNLSQPKVPDFTVLNRHLGPASGWQLVAVEGLLPGEAFFKLLADRKFPVTWWMRSRDQMDYLPEPDLFHDAYGHVPMLMDPAFGDFVHHYAVASLRANDEQRLHLGRVYWFTVEFGLVGPLADPRIYGAGIMSSATESVHALENPAVERVPFDPHAAMAQDYRIDIPQPKYFVVESVQSLYQTMKPILESI